jgi:PTS system mannose-specific IIA component
LKSPQLLLTTVLRRMVGTFPPVVKTEGPLAFKVGAGSTNQPYAGCYMIGIVVVSHGLLAEALVEAAEIIIGSRPAAMEAISIDLTENAEKLRTKISKGIKAVDGKEGVLILTDMFGGTPSNLSYSFLEEGHIEVLSGVNLPILIQAVNWRDKGLELARLAADLEGFGKKSISLASGILKGNKRS